MAPIIIGSKTLLGSNQIAVQNQYVALTGTSLRTPSAGWLTHLGGYFWRPAAGGQHVILGAYLFVN